MRKPATNVAGRNSGWRAVTWVLLFTFSLQSFVTQTHIHGTPQAVAGASAVTSLESAAGHKSPIQNDIAACPFCHAIVHAGAFFAPVAPFLLRPVLLAERATPCLVAIAIRAQSGHSWHSRAPPQH